MCTVVSLVRFLRGLFAVLRSVRVRFALSAILACACDVAPAHLRTRDVVALLGVRMRFCAERNLGVAPAHCVRVMLLRSLACACALRSAQSWRCARALRTRDIVALLGVRMRFALSAVLALRPRICAHVMLLRSLACARQDCAQRKAHAHAKKRNQQCVRVCRFSPSVFCAKVRSSNILYVQRNPKKINPGPHVMAVL